MPRSRANPPSAAGTDGREGRRPLLPRALDVAGRTFITTGLLMLAFVAYQLWGTGIEQAGSQRALQRKYEIAYPARQSTLVNSTTLPRIGEPVGRMSVPRIGLDTWIVAGAKYEQLEMGPGVFTTSPLPGQAGNLAIAGHRTSYGAPFEHLDELRYGDTVTFRTPQGMFTYMVTSSEIVLASNVDVIRTLDRERAQMTLITCHPKWTSAKRLVVHGELTSAQKPLVATPLMEITQEIREEVTPGWFHDTSRIVPTVLFSLVLVAIVLVTRRVAGSGWRKVIVWGLSGGVFLVTLYFTFRNLSGLLPANL